MKSVLITILVVLFALAVTAADGDGCAANRTAAAAGMFDVSCVLLCDGKTSADNSCTQYQFRAAPRIVQVEIAEDDSCSGAAAVTFTSQSATGTDVHNLTTWTLTRGGDTAKTIEGTSAQTLAYLNIALGTMTDCTNLDVKMHLYY